MRVLFDQGTPDPLRGALVGFEVKTAFQCGWHQLENGALLAAAEAAAFDVFVTTDRNLKYQQNLQHRRIAIVALLTTNYPRIHPKAQRVIDAVRDAKAGDYIEVSFEERSS